MCDAPGSRDRTRPIAAVVACATLSMAALVHGASGDDEPPINPQRPVITEVFFNVPKGDDGDATGDGKRDPTGDEFVEIWNPTEDAIELEGWSIVSRLAWHAEDERAKRGVRFTFPSFELPAGETVVVFNGHGSRISGRVGTERRAPKERNERFASEVGGAWVFRMPMNSANRAFSNTADFALLLDAEGEPVEGVVWGDPELGPPDPEGEDESGEWVEIYALHSVSKNPKGSVQREIGEKGALGRFVPHVRLEGELVCSPGLVPEAPEADDEEGSGGGE